MFNHVDHRRPPLPVLPAPAHPTHVGDHPVHLAGHPAPRRRRDRRLAGGDRPRHAPTPHSLTREEVFVVLAGTASATLDGVMAEALAGDAIVAPPDVAFSLANGGDEPLRLLCCLPVGGQARTAEGGTFTLRGPSDLTGPAGPAVRNGLPRPDRRPARAAAPARVARRPTRLRVRPARGPRRPHQRHRAGRAHGCVQAGGLQARRRHAAAAT